MNEYCTHVTDDQLVIALYACQAYNFQTQMLGCTYIARILRYAVTDAYLSDAYDGDFSNLASQIRTELERRNVTYKP